MSLNRKQVNYILSKRKKFSAKRLAEKLNVEVDEVERVLSENPAKKAPALFYVLMLLFPFLIVLLLEISLRVFDYGIDYDVFVTVSEDFPDLYVLNPELPKKYFGNSEFIPAVIPDLFKKEKPEESFRVFVLGGSTTAGWPFVYNASFSRYLQRKLELLYPSRLIEVVNLGMSAVNSYTMRDFIDEVIEQNADLIIIYAGHNEYYGALGAGSTLSFGSSPALVNLILKLQDFKTVQLITNFISGTWSLFTDGDKGLDNSETLMSRMIGNSTIEFDSKEYLNGIEQFETNMDYIFAELDSKNIPVVVGLLTSNLKQKPFVSIKDNPEKDASIFFTKGENYLEQNEFVKAKEKLFFAKEYDALRFRAPEAMNKTIKTLAKKYSLLVVDMDSVFSLNSPDSIVGYNLMIDHLHPNVEGHKIMGEVFFDACKKHKYFPELGSNLSNRDIDSILNANFPYTKLDSVWAELRVRKLLGTFPFVEEGKPNYLLMNFKQNNLIDSLAVKWFTRKVSHHNAHKQLADFYFKQGEYLLFIKEYDAIIKDSPYGEINYAQLIDKLISIQYFDEALPYLFKLNSLNSNDYTTKWIGSIAVNKGDYKTAIKYLTKSAEYNPKDYQVYYNLAGAYYLAKDYDKANNAVKRSLELNSSYQPAIKFYEGLKSLVNSEKE